MGDAAVPAITFTLADAGQPGSYSVVDGCFTGMSSVPVPSSFGARLSGQLDCESGRLTGQLGGRLRWIGIPGAAWMFEGTTTARLDPSGTQLLDGAWKTKELGLSGEVEESGLGLGSGTWSASLVAPAAPAHLPPCAP